MEFSLKRGMLKTKVCCSIGYVDSDFATNIDSRKSQTGYIFTFFGAAVSWKSVLQSVVALSTKAE